jgi:cysteinyl-tRNA synthetase
LVFRDYDKIYQDPTLCHIVVDIIENCLGMILLPDTSSQTQSSPVTMSLEIAELISQRDKARAEKNWPVADEIRKKLFNLGHTVVDEKKS